MGKYVMVGMNHRDAEEYVAALPADTELRLERDPQNPVDPFAVKVMHGDRHVAFIKATQAKPLALAMDSKGETMRPAKLHVGSWPCAITE